MAKAQFHKHQKVWVESVGAWAAIERLVPVWSKGFDEPIRITYDCGLGREFMAHELRAEDEGQPAAAEDAGEWRLMRAKNKWQPPEECVHHPYPGTFPVVVTDKNDWGGWRVPGAEYDRDPFKMEFQARLIASAPQLLKLARELTAFVADAPEDAPMDIQRLARLAGEVERYISDAPQGPNPTASEMAAE